MSLNKTKRFEHQPALTVNQAAPVQNTWYTILGITKNVRLINCQMQVNLVNETVEMRITVDGVQLVGSIAAVFGQNYQAYLGFAGDGLYLVTTHLTAQRSFLLEGRTVKVEMRKTTANGAGNLVGTVVYAKIV